MGRRFQNDGLLLRDGWQNGLEDKGDYRGPAVHIAPIIAVQPHRGFKRRYSGRMKLLAAMALLAVPAVAQHTLAARSGTISYLEGTVLLDGKAIDTAAGPPVLKVNSMLRTENGRVEVLLNPCAVLHVDANSSARLLDDAVNDVRMELVAGSAIAQVDGGAKFSGVGMLIRQTTVRLGKNGIYRFGSDPPRVKVWDGVATVVGVGKVGAGREWTLGGNSVKFNRNRNDALERWHDERIQALVAGSGVAADQARQRSRRREPPLPQDSGPPGVYTQPQMPVHWPDEYFAPGRLRVCMP